MARITLDPDDVNQDVEVTLTDGTVVELAAAEPAVLHRIARQLHTHRSTYEAAFAPRDEEIASQVATGALRLDQVAPLHRRVFDLLEAVKGRGGRSATQLDLAVLLQTRTWTSSSGASQPLEALTPSHRRNLIGWLERNSDELEQRFGAAPMTPDQRAQVEPAEPWVAGTPLYRRIATLITSESPTEQVKDQARQVVRRVEFERHGRWPDR